MSPDIYSQYAARLEEFLAYFEKNEQALRDVMKFEGVKGLALQVWKDSRAAVVVELPHPGANYDYRDSQVSGACKHHAEAVKAIEAAGVKVAP